MSEKVYGISINDKITPLMVRDAIVSCFFKAHCEDTGVAEEKGANREYCKMIVQDAFEKIGGNFDDPTRDDIFKVMENLAIFSESFRNPDIINKHKKQIAKLLDKMSQ